MSDVPELTNEELDAHASAIFHGALEGEEAFRRAFAAYAKACIERETDPYEKIAGFVYSMLGFKSRFANPDDAIEYARRILNRGRA